MTTTDQSSTFNASKITQHNDAITTPAPNDITQVEEIAKNIANLEQWISASMLVPSEATMGNALNTPAVEFSESYYQTALKNNKSLK